MSELTDKRLDLIEEMRQKNPKDSFLNYAAALEYHKIGSVDKAVELLEYIIKNDPDYLGAYYKLGKLYEDNNKIKKAIAVYKSGKVIAKKQNDLKTIGELTEALMILDADEDDW